MKLYGQNLEKILISKTFDKNFALFYGPDQGLVHECAIKIQRLLLGGSIDSRNIVQISGKQIKESPSILFNASLALSLFNKTQLVFVSDGTDAITGALKSLLNQKIHSWPILITAGDLPPRSSIRKLFEQNTLCATIACYPDENESLTGFINQTLIEKRIIASSDTLSFLSTNLGGDRMVVRQEINKIALYLNSKPTHDTILSTSDAQLCLQDSSLHSLDKLVLAVSSGQQNLVDHLLFKSFREGINPITIIRSLQRHFHRLHNIKSKINRGKSFEQAALALKPPVFFKWKAPIKYQITIWNAKKLNHAISMLLEYEIECKKSYLPERTMCGHLLMRIASGAKKL